MTAHEAQERQPVLLHQVIEAEEVEERERPHHVDDDARPRRVAHVRAPHLVDRDVREEPPVEPTQERVRLVRTSERGVGLSLRGLHEGHHTARASARSAR